MKIKPNENFSLAGTNLELDKNKIYFALIAYNQPEWEKLRKVFVVDSEQRFEIILQAGEYKIVD